MKHEGRKRGEDCELRGGIAQKIINILKGKYFCVDFLNGKAFSSQPCLKSFFKSSQTEGIDDDDDLEENEFLTGTSRKIRARKMEGVSLLHVHLLPLLLHSHTYIR